MDCPGCWLQWEPWKQKNSTQLRQFGRVWGFRRQTGTWMSGFQIPPVLDVLANSPWCHFPICQSRRRKRRQREKYTLSADYKPDSLYVLSDFSLSKDNPRKQGSLLQSSTFWVSFWDHHRLFPESVVDKYSFGEAVHSIWNNWNIIPMILSNNSNSK